MSSVIVCAISRATLWKKKISRAARIERAKGRPRSSLSLRARSSRGEGSLMVTTSSSSVGVLDIELPRIRLYVLLARNSDTSNSPESQAPDRAEDVTKAVLARIGAIVELRAERTRVFVDDEMGFGSLPRSAENARAWAFARLTRYASFMVRGGNRTLYAQKYPDRWKARLVLLTPSEERASTLTEVITEWQEVN